MNPKGIIIFICTLLGLALAGVGMYVTIDNFINPQGNLFEGVMSFAVGCTMLLIIAALSFMGKVVMIFQAIYEQTVTNQVLIQDEFNRRMKQQQNIPNITDMLKGMGMSENMVIQPIAGSEELFKSIFGNLGSNKKGKSFEEMNTKELGKELKKAEEEENFEKAGFIKELINRLNNPDTPDEEAGE